MLQSNLVVEHEIFLKNCSAVHTLQIIITEIHIVDG